MINHLSKLLFKVLKDYNIPITRRSIELEVNTNPEYPSMQCISDTFRFQVSGLSYFFKKLGARYEGENIFF